LGRLAPCWESNYYSGVRRAFLSLLLLATLAGCSRAPKPPLVGSTAPEFTVTDADRTVALKDLRGKVVVLNFWATWCPPCVREMPLLDRFSHEQRTAGWQVLGLAIDHRDPVLEFLSRRPVGYPIGLAGADGVGLARSLGNAQGALPFSVIFDRAGTIVDRKLGAIQPEDFTRWVATVG
ncbi:MAG: TlpA family protein disulfide reductase, partial [Burkholderiales bacterium]|nr:TlpA family protein disulfide reductase [Burkholderiales bacterium]